VKEDAATPAALELLEIRALALNDRVDQLVASYFYDEPSSLEERSEELDEDNPVASLLDEITSFEARRSRLSPTPDWLDSRAELSLRAAAPIQFLLEINFVDEIRDEIEGHGTTHSYPCRCDTLRAHCLPMITSIFDEYESLSREIERLIRIRRQETEHD
jgi:hypothetical protein